MPNNLTEPSLATFITSEGRTAAILKLMGVLTGDKDNPSSELEETESVDRRLWLSWLDDSRETGQRRQSVTRVNQAKRKNCPPNAQNPPIASGKSARIGRMQKQGIETVGQSRSYTSRILNSLPCSQTQTNQARTTAVSTLGVT